MLIGTNPILLKSQKQYKSKVNIKIKYTTEVFWFGVCWKLQQLAGRMMAVSVQCKDWFSFHKLNIPFSGVMLMKIVICTIIEYEHRKQLLILMFYVLYFILVMNANCTCICIDWIKSCYLFILEEKYFKGKFEICLHLCNHINIGRKYQPDGYCKKTMFWTKTIVEYYEENRNTKISSSFNRFFRKLQLVNV